MAMKTVADAAEARQRIEPNEKGRCIYCGERCDFDATCHEYCRVEHQMAAHRARRKTRPHAQHDASEAEPG